MAFVAQQTIIGIEDRLKNHPHREEMLGMIAAARAGGAVAMPYFERVLGGEKLDQTTKDTTFDKMGFEDVFTQADTET